MNCEWCQSKDVTRTKKIAYWELPSGRRAVEITAIPSLLCSNCHMHYIEDQLVEEIEDQLMLIDTKQLPMSINYNELMDRPRLLAKNYFKP